MLNDINDSEIKKKETKYLIKNKVKEIKIYQKRHTVGAISFPRDEQDKPYFR
jgi:hypothetical protein